MLLCTQKNIGILILFCLVARRAELYNMYLKIFKILAVNTQYILKTIFLFFHLYNFEKN